MNVEGAPAGYTLQRMARRTTGSGDEEPSEFPPTSWSDIAQAKDKNHPTCREAWNRLTLAYWKPLLSIARRYVRSIEDAEDLIQKFLARKYETDFLAKANGNARFRSFLKEALKNHFLNEKEAGEALKRGGGRKRVPLEGVSDPTAEEIDRTTDEEITAHRQRLLAQAIELLRAYYLKKDTGKKDRSQYWLVFSRWHGIEAREDPSISPFLPAPMEDPAYREIATELGLTVDQVTRYLHHARAKFKLFLIEVYARENPDHQNPRQGCSDFFTD